MGTSKSVPELVGKFQRAATDLQAVNADVLSSSGMAVKASVLRRAAPATGGDLKLSGARNRSVGVRYRVSGDSVDIRATGPMHWMEGGTKPHAVAPKKLGGSRAARSAFVANAFGTGRSSLQFGKKVGALKFKDGGFAKYARTAGGLKAQHVWSKGTDDAQPTITAVFRSKVERTIIRAFAG